MPRKHLAQATASKLQAGTEWADPLLTQLPLNEPGGNIYRSSSFCLSPHAPA